MGPAAGGTRRAEEVVVEQQGRESRVALFVDVENLAIEAQKAGLQIEVSRIVGRVKEEGRIIFARAYADWSQMGMQRLLRDFQNNVVELEQLCSGYAGKNTADMQLALDALEMCLQPSGPDVVVLGAGDRDFVPLVQKLKRYGKRLIGIGVRGSISGSLEKACDTYIYYDALVPDQRVPSRVAEHDVSRAIELLLRALTSQQAQGREPTGASTADLMRRLDPTFDLRNLGYPSFKSFVEDAEKRGAVRVHRTQAYDVLLEPLREAQSLATEQSSESDPARAEAESTPPGADRPEDLAQIYRQVLHAKKVPLLPREQRERLVRGLWSMLQQRREGLTIVEMGDELVNHAICLSIDVPTAAIHKIVYTLNIGCCFQSNGIADFERDINHVRLRPAVDPIQAIRRMDLTYLRGIQMDRPDLDLVPEAVSLLLFDSKTPSQMRQAREYISEVRRR